ncbi:PIB60 cell number regulator-like protein [Striga asiatica]|uniref:PIB60 cell number regulator-like protein n=1 Tax=Striga asiatica TaxID=4170 RepID=A0A5A7P7K9_STRAF|nr:PIB60 cell number regulator-like protein [Striga asiatica]
MGNSEESNPLLPNQEQESGATAEKKPTPVHGCKHGGSPPPAAVPIGWTADGLPVGEPMTERAQWSSGIFSCLGTNDEFCSSDLEVCLLGSMAPCVLYGTNVERLGLTPNNTFANHCLPYTGFYLIGQTFFGWNCLAPWFSYPVRTAIRRKFNLEGSCEAVTRSCSCLGSFVEDEDQREQCETVCDFGAHILCHACALCQEGREVRRRLTHPGFNSRPVLVMIPPPVQAMGNSGE